MDDFNYHVRITAAEVPRSRGSRLCCFKWAGI